MKVGPGLLQVYEDAQKMLKEIVNGRKLQANGIAAFYPANAVGDDIEVYEDEERVRFTSKLLSIPASGWISLAFLCVQRFGMYQGAVLTRLLNAESTRA